MASLWICLKVAKEASALLRMQLAGLLLFTGAGRSAGTPGAPAAAARSTGASLRTYGARLSSAARAAGSELALAGTGGAGLVAAGRAAGFVGRRGLVGSAAAGATGAAAKAAPAGARLMERSRAGALAARMARAGTASWAAATPNPKPARPQRPTDATHRARRHDGRSPRDDTPSAPDPAASTSGGRPPRQDTGPRRQRARPVARRPVEEREAGVPTDREPAGRPAKPGAPSAGQSDAGPRRFTRTPAWRGATDAQRRAASRPRDVATLGAFVGASATRDPGRSDDPDAASSQ